MPLTEAVDRTTHTTHGGTSAAPDTAAAAGAPARDGAAPVQAAPRRGAVAVWREALSTLRDLAPLREDPAALQFGGAEFARVARYLAEVQSAPGGLTRLATAVRRADDSARAVRLLALLPRERVAVSSSPAGEEVWGFLSRTVAGVALPRPAQAVLTLPDTLQEHLRGRSRQALRTGLNHAKKAGLRCTELLTAQERSSALQELTVALDGDFTGHESLQGQHPRWFEARSADGDLVALGLVLIDAEVAMLRFLVSVDDRASSDARYALHTRMVEEVIASGVRTLVVHSPFGWPAGLHQFQRILGYRIVNLLVSRRG
ncbi:hypothetical protein [Kineococcus indalonis]|uniref:hypothetical protein n=1 Tax=Kineococcus indalonis TaxID=2696566 RepID=UPI001411E271|nr:hypothetical protein [Kineococcus indalonis]NAZ85996.1 hypothetical protein [Kineococcus indalonis]